VSGPAAREIAGPILERFARDPARVPGTRLEQAIEAEAQAQALCMHTEDFRRAYRAFLAKQKPVFEGN
jgi:enoyl-CoA hydratase/carnithine racemase